MSVSIDRREIVYVARLDFDLPGFVIFRRFKESSSVCPILRSRGLNFLDKAAMARYAFLGVTPALVSNPCNVSFLWTVKTRRLTVGFKCGIVAEVTVVRGAALVRVWRGSRSGAGLLARPGGALIDGVGASHVAPDAPRMTPKMTLFMIKY